MPCPRCYGLLLNDGEELRCINCGHRIMERQDAKIERQSEAMMALGGTCTKCKEPAADDSVQCIRHRDMTRRANAKFQGRAINGSTPVPKPSRVKTVQGGGIRAVIKPNGSAVPHLIASNGGLLGVIETLIASAHDDVAALERVRAMLDGHGV